MPNLEMRVRDTALAFVLETYDLYFTEERTSGFDDHEGERGNGEIYEYLSKLTIQEYLRRHCRKRSGCVLVSGAGDGGADLHFYERDPANLTRTLIKRADLKTSNQAPREDLHLFIKKEDIQRHPADYYLQVSVRFGRIDSKDGEKFVRPIYGPEPGKNYLVPQAAKIHVLGWCSPDDESWAQGEWGQIPNTGIKKADHEGYRIPVSALKPFESLIERMQGIATS